ncbi:MAG: ketoacyl-ACP synthase III [Erysipelotrichaceae bacterium]|nr:ketoacyl-ACP synthase III [Erysipelotrichaceae bacterium]
MSKLNIRGIGHYIPDTLISNDELSRIMDTSDEWITKRTGIKTRYVSSNDDTSILAFEAAKRALEDANITIEEIDLVICATITPDDFTPSVACKLLKYFKTDKIMALDINAACSGFVYALNVASSLLEANGFKYALVVGAEKLSKLLDYNDRSTAILFGDGAGACVVSADENNAYFYCKAKGDTNDVLYASGVKGSKPLNNSCCEDYYLKMNGREVYRFAVDALDDAITSILNKSQMTIEDIDYIVPHQANIRIIDQVAKQMNIPYEKVLTNLNKFGNTSAASIPLLLSEAYNENKIKKGDNVLLAGFGAGLTWASAIIKM